MILPVMVKNTRNHLWVSLRPKFGNKRAKAYNNGLKKELSFVLYISLHSSCLL
nr:hypothetical protein [Capnocytophaga canimorsus]